MGHRHSPKGSSSTSTEDEEENEDFREPQLLDLDGFLEFDDLDGVHALMVRTLEAKKLGLAVGCPSFSGKLDCFSQDWLDLQNGEELSRTDRVTISSTRGGFDGSPCQVLCASLSFSLGK